MHVCECVCVCVCERGWWGGNGWLSRTMRSRLSYSALCLSSVRVSNAALASMKASLAFGCMGRRVGRRTRQ
jgi:hypothetical protein